MTETVWRAIALCVLVISAPVLAESGPVEIEIFTDENFPIIGIETLRDSGVLVTEYDLGAPKRVARELGAGLSGDAERAKAAVMARVNAMGMAEFKRRFQVAYRGQIQALKYRIERYPAIVFDQGDAVVYGVTELSEALRRYRGRSAGYDE